MPAPPCQVPGNSDIAGIGVRVAVYTQAALVVLISYVVEYKNTSPSAVPQKQSRPPRHKIHYDNANVNKNVEKILGQFSYITKRSAFAAADRALEQSIFITGCAIVVSAFIEAYSKKGSGTGLSDYHALVVLNLSFINYWAGFSLLRRRTEHMKIRILLDFIGDAKRTARTWVAFYIHATIFSVLGILFWINQSRFLRYTQDRDGAIGPHPCQPSVVYWVFRPIPLTSRPLKIASLTFYFLSAVPVLTGLVTQAISLFVAGLLMCITTLAAVPFILISLLISFPLVHCTKPFTSLDGSAHNFVPRAFKRLRKLPKEFPILHWHATRFTYTVPIIYWIVATEMIIQSNAAHVEVSVEKQLNYGQTSTLLTTSMTIGFLLLQIVEEKQEVQETRPMLADLLVEQAEVLADERERLG